MKRVKNFPLQLQRHNERYSYNAYYDQSFLSRDSLYLWESSGTTYPMSVTRLLMLHSMDNYEELSDYSYQLFVIIVVGRHLSRKWSLISGFEAKPLDGPAVFQSVPGPEVITDKESIWLRNLLPGDYKLVHISISW